MPLWGRASDGDLGGHTNHDHVDEESNSWEVSFLTRSAQDFSIRDWYAKSLNISLFPRVCHSVSLRPVLGAHKRRLGAMRARPNRYLTTQAPSNQLQTQISKRLLISKPQANSSAHPTSTQSKSPSYSAPPLPAPPPGSWPASPPPRAP